MFQNCVYAFNVWPLLPLVYFIFPFQIEVGTFLYLKKYINTSILPISRECIDISDRYMNLSSNTNTIYLRVDMHRYFSILKKMYRNIDTAHFEQIYRFMGSIHRYIAHHFSQILLVYGEVTFETPCTSVSFVFDTFGAYFEDNDKLFIATQNVSSLNERSWLNTLKIVNIFLNTKFGIESLYLGLSHRYNFVNQFQGKLYNSIAFYNTECQFVREEGESLVVTLTPFRIGLIHALQFLFSRMYSNANIFLAKLSFLRNIFQFYKKKIKKSC